jgi:hypothetical protein
VTPFGTPPGALLPGDLPLGDLLLGGAALVVAVRVAVAVAQARQRAGDWPPWRLLPSVAALVGHDVVVGLAGYGLLGVVPMSVLVPAGADLRLVAVAGVLLALALSGRVLRRRRGLPVAALGAVLSRPGTLALDPLPTLRDALLATIERRAGRASAAWITGQLDTCRRRCAVTEDQLLPALLAPVRSRLRESVGVSRTEVALLLLQAQSVADDASPARERLLTLLHLVHQRCGRRAVRAVLEAARPALAGDSRTLTLR